MTVVAAVCVMAAVLLALPPPGQAADRLGAQASPTADFAVRRRIASGLAAAVVGVAVLAAALTWAGARGVVVTVAAGMAVGIIVRLAKQRSASRRALQAREEVAHGCAVLASQVRVGRIPAEALQIAAADCAVLARADAVQRLGGDVVAAWRDTAAQPGHRGLLDLARAWEVSAKTGAPLASALDQVARSLLDDHRSRAVVAGELAAPRATGQVMAALPFCGLGLGFLIGGDPVGFLLAGPYGWACLLVGVALAGAGVLWIDRLARAAGHQE